MKARLLGLLTAFALLIPLCPAAAAFDDVPEGAWYASAAQWAAGQGLLPSGEHLGVGQSVPAEAWNAMLRKLAPGAAAEDASGVLTRARAAASLYALAERGAEAGEPFSDVPPESPYFGAVVWARAAGVVNGTAEGVFSPDGPVLWEQAVVMLHRFFTRPDGGARAAAQLNWRFAERPEGQALLLGNADYFAGMNQLDLDYRVQKKNATQDELRQVCADAVRAFAPAEKALVNKSMALLERRLAALGCVLPLQGEIVFVATTMAEEGGAAGYTHGNQIYLNEPHLALLAEAPAEDGETPILLAHELFHVLTRGDAAFRAAMYGTIGFTVAEKEFTFPDAVRETMLSNPDVNAHDSYAAFTIGGKKTDCALILRTDRRFEKPGDSFFDGARVGVVPLDAPGTVYDVSDVPDFFDVVGRNTGYVIDPEECLADNFALALVRGLDGEQYQTPALIEAILAFLRAMN